MTSIAFATLLFVSLALCLALAFSNERLRPRLKWSLVASLLLLWASLAVAVAQIFARTASAVVTPGGARQPHLLGPSAREALTVLVSHGGPALLATLLAGLAVKASRRKPATPAVDRTP